jgi:hypothetical protein
MLIFMDFKLLITEENVANVRKRNYIISDKQKINENALNSRSTIHSWIGV